MAEIQLSVKVDGEKSLDEEIKDFKNYLILRSAQALEQVQGQMTEHLENRIIEDVYNKYTPKEYPRRYDNPQFGDPLTSLMYMDALGPSGGITSNGDISMMAGLDYNPRGEHSGTTADLSPDSPYYDADNPSPLKPNPVHENELIRRIETGKGYDWKVPSAVYKGRPFWQNFVNEMIEGGQLGALFLQAMKELGVGDIELAYDEVEREPNDGEY